QQDLSKKLNDNNAERKGPQLRDSGQRQQVAEDLAKQKKDLEKLLDNMKNTVEESEVAEPLLSKQLYHSIRQARNSNTDKNLDTAKQMLEKGLPDEAKRSEAEAGKGVAKLREGVE